MPFEIHVESYAGHRGDEAPRAFVLAGERILVTDVVDRWLAPDHRYFKVRSAAGDEFILRHDIVTGAWEITFFKRNEARG